MKVKTLISVEKDLLDTVDKLSGKNRKRSEFIEAAIHAYVANLPRSNKEVDDLEIINEFVDILNREAMDVLDYQVTL